VICGNCDTSGTRARELIPEGPGALHIAAEWRSGGGKEAVRSRFLGTRDSAPSSSGFAYVLVAKPLG